MTTIAKHYAFDLFTGEEGLGIVGYKTSSDQKFYNLLFCKAKVIKGDEYINYIEYDCNIDCSEKYPSVFYRFVKGVK